MCGIFAVFQRSGPICPAELTAATDTLTHRGPDHGATVCVSLATSAGEVYAGLGHRRLSIIDLDSRSDQPFHRPGGWLVYNGEIYNFREARDRLLHTGPFGTEGDTEVLYRAVATTGQACLEGFSGMWAFAFLDMDKRHVLAGRDRYGKKPLFYYADNRVVCLASEAKAIFAYLKRRPVMRRDWIDRYLAHGICCPDPGGETFFETIREVRPGHALHFDLDAWSLAERPWFDFAAAVSEDRPPLKAAVETAVLSRLLSDRPVGLLLSGGVDSSLILSVLAANGLQHQVRCFIGETGKNVSEDAAYARQCAEAVGVTADEIPSDYGAAAFERILSMCRHHEKPFPLTGNSVAMHEMYAHIATHDVPVVIDGTGGDEVFGGYWDRYIFFAIRDAMRAGDSGWLEALVAANRDNPETQAHIRAAMRRMTGAGSPAASSNRVSAFSKDGVRSARPFDPLMHHEGTLVEAMTTDAAAGRLSEWIWHNDRNAMAFGIENRSPFLDCGLIPMIGVSYPAKFNGEWNKLVLRQLYSEFIPLPTQWRRQKQGFRWPSHRFLRENSPRVIERIAGSRTLPDHVDIVGWLDAWRSSPEIVTEGFTARLLCIAAMEDAFP